MKLTQGDDQMTYNEATARLAYAAAELAKDVDGITLPSNQRRTWMREIAICARAIGAGKV